MPQDFLLQINPSTLSYVTRRDNGRFQWNHDMLSELSRVARKRIIFQHWFIPADRHCRWKKYHKFRMATVYAWQPKTYFGRAQIITLFDAVDGDIPEDSAFTESPAWTTSSGPDILRPALHLCPEAENSVTHRGHPSLRDLRKLIGDAILGKVQFGEHFAKSILAEVLRSERRGARFRNIQSSCNVTYLLLCSC